MKESVIIFVGVLTEYQGVDLLVEAVPYVVQKVPECKFLIVGYPNEERYRQKARDLGVQSWVHFTGKISYEDVPRYLSLADIAVSPKLSSTEANLKLFSYMAMGLPTVVFDSAINREILGDVGVYAEMANSKALADALIRVLKDKEWAKQVGLLSRQKAADEYSWSLVGKRLGEIYNAIGNGRNGSSKESTHAEIEDIGDRRRRFLGFPSNKRASRPGAHSPSHRRS
jgi:glycosyltransferase involved in cell wall biosynthesis